MENEPKFSKFRSFFWPIHRHELSKFLPMLVLFFIVSINYDLLHILKDVLVITAPQSGAEAIPFLKVWAILPSAVLFTFFFTKLANAVTREKLFYVLMLVFLGFFLLFTFVLYPFREHLYLHRFADFLQSSLPSGFKGFIAMIRYWIFSLFYIMADSWSNIIFTLLLWGFVNDVIKIKEASRFYALFGVGYNAAGMVAGKMGEIFSTHMSLSESIPAWVSFFGGKTSWDQTFFILMFIIISCILGSIYIHRWLHVHVFVDREKEAALPINNKTKKMSFKETLAYVFKSKYVLSIALVILSYNIFINFTEVLWKSQLKELFPNPEEYTAYFSRVTFFIGIFATLGSYLISGNVLRKFGWKFTAYLTPVIMMATGAGFFYFLFLKEFTTASTLVFGMTPLALTVFFGSLQNVLSRAAKYTVFDNTKEMAFIPLNSDEKLKAKSAIDGIGSRLGKSGSSLTLQVLLMFFSTILATAPIILAIMILILPVWFLSIKALGKKFQEFTTTSESEIA